jgi:ketosteroid isomerase-like protein
LQGPEQAKLYHSAIAQQAGVNHHRAPDARPATQTTEDHMPGNIPQTHTCTPAHAARELVRNYLEAMERRDLTAASAMLAPGFRMVFPGGREFDSLSALVHAAKGRYRSANKRYERFDALVTDTNREDDAVTGNSPECVVYCYGMLYGELLSGETYDNIRFIDRFSVRDGKLIDQMVWNDMAEVLGSKLPSL